MVSMVSRSEQNTDINIWMKKKMGIFHAKRSITEMDTIFSWAVPTPDPDRIVAATRH